LRLTPKPTTRLHAATSIKTACRCRKWRVRESPHANNKGPCAPLRMAGLSADGPSRQVGMPRTLARLAEQPARGDRADLSAGMRGTHASYALISRRTPRCTRMEPGSSAGIVDSKFAPKRWLFRHATELCEQSNGLGICGLGQQGASPSVSPRTKLP
jgi:hypothetical protein